MIKNQSDKGNKRARKVNARVAAIKMSQRVRPMKPTIGNNNKYDVITYYVEQQPNGEVWHEKILKG